MSLKAGRVGVNPADVNPVNGKIQVEVPDNVYTKTQVDNKFETKTHASNTYQPKTLAVPISMLQGSLLVPKTTVEDVIQTMDNAMTNMELTELATVQESACTNAVGTVSTNKLYKQGSVVELDLILEGVTASAWDVLGKIPSGYRPKYNIRSIAFNTSNDNTLSCQLRADGDIKIISSISSANVLIQATWMTD